MGVYDEVYELIEKRINSLQDVIDNTETGSNQQNNLIAMLQTCIDEDKKIIQLIKDIDYDLNQDEFGFR